MRAVIYDRYGPPEVLRLDEIEEPKLTEDRVLVRVHAVSLNPADWHMRNGGGRFFGGGWKPKSIITGSDFSGIVEAVDSHVTGYQPGDAVFGSKRGALAERICVGTNSIALKPANITFEQAAGVPIAGVTALQSLRDTGQIQSGQHVLVNGASGGVGTCTVQIAKSYGAHVTGVCSTRNLDLVRSLGADRVIDYTREQVTRHGEVYDLIMDNVGNLTLLQRLRALRPGGICVGVGYHSPGLLVQSLLLGQLISKAGDKKIRSMLAHITNKDLLWLKERMEKGQFKPVVDRCFPVSETVQAFRYAETKHARAKVVITWLDK